MKSFNLEYLDKLTFTVEQISSLRALGEYRGKQALFFKQSPEALKSLQLPQFGISTGPGLFKELIFREGFLGLREYAAKPLIRLTKKFIGLRCLECSI